MTIRDLFQMASADSKWLLYYFIGIPILCFILFLIIKDSNKAYKINWIFSILCFLVVIPGIFTITLIIYQFLFERQSILDFNIESQLLPILSMVVSLTLIRKIIAFDYIPGFEKLSSLSAIIFGIMAILWLLDRTHIMAVTMLPISFILIGFIVVILFLRFGLSRLF